MKKNGRKNITPYRLEWSTGVKPNLMFKYGVEGLLVEEGEKKVLHVLSSYEIHPWGTKTYGVSDERIVEEVRKKGEIDEVVVYKLGERRQEALGEEIWEYRKFPYNLKILSDLVGLAAATYVASQFNNLLYAVGAFFFSAMFFPALFEVMAEEYHAQLNRDKFSNLLEELKSSGISYKQYSIARS